MTARDPQWPSITRVVVTGASGWIGREVCRAAVARGLGVIGLIRSGGPGLNGVRYAVADILRDSLFDLTALAQGAHALIHCAAYVHRRGISEVEKLRFHEVNGRGTQQVLEFARRSHIGRVVYLGSISIYDWSQKLPPEEHDSLHATSAYAQSKLAGERACEHSGLDWVIARLATVFGSGDHANMAHLARALKRRRFVLPGTGEAKKSLLSVTLAADLLVDLALRRCNDARVINLALPDSPSLKEICVAFEEICGFPRPPSLSLRVLGPICRIGDLAAHLYPAIPFTTDALQKLTAPTVVNTALMQRLWPNYRWPSFAEALNQNGEYYRRI